MESKGHIKISSRLDHDLIKVSIQDNGSGIAEPNLARIFEPFFTTKEIGKGTGLGLSISYDIIKKHHGDIKVESTLNEGTTFTIELPLAVSGDDLCRNRIKLLLVDDEANILKAVRRLLVEEPQYEIFSAESGEEGLSILENTADIRLVVADYRMPQMDGIEFLTRVYRRWPDIMRMVLSGYAGYRGRR